MNMLLWFAVGVTRAWTALYTHGLSIDLRTDRREEMDCDLWEHQRQADLGREPVASTAVQILLRVALGIPADILWRLHAGSAQDDRRISVNQTWPMRIGLVVALLPLAVLAAFGVSFTLGYGDWNNSIGHWIWRLLWLACPVAGGMGLWLCAARPRVGMGLVLAGVGGSSVLMPWMAFITVPIGLVIIAFAIKRSGLAIWPSKGPRPSASGTA